MDVYLISDSEEMPTFPEEVNLLFLSKLNLEEFKQIETFLPENISFFEDFRLTHREVKELCNKLIASNIYKSSSGKVASVLKIEHICKTAIDKNLGIAGFSD